MGLAQCRVDKVGGIEAGNLKQLEFQHVLAPVRVSAIKGREQLAVKTFTSFK